MSRASFRTPWPQQAAGTISVSLAAGSLFHLFLHFDVRIMDNRVPETVPLLTARAMMYLFFVCFENFLIKSETEKTRTKMTILSWFFLFA